jgi:hypothetical protein
MFPMALSALRPTARQRRESGAKGCDHSGTFRPRSHTPVLLFLRSLATPHGLSLWRSGGAPPKRRFLGRGKKPDPPLVCSVSHRNAPSRLVAPARRGTDPPGDFYHPLHRQDFPGPPKCWERPPGKRWPLHAPFFPFHTIKPPAPDAVGNPGKALLFQMLNQPLKGHRFAPRRVAPEDQHQQFPERDLAAKAESSVTNRKIERSPRKKFGPECQQHSFSYLSPPSTNFTWESGT